jgi:ATP-dependent Zn protease
MAGTIAEKIYLKSKGYEVCPGYTKSDLRLIMNKAEKYFGITEPDVIDKKLKELEPECKNLIEQNCKAITAIVEALLKEETIGYKKAREIIKRIK